MILAVPAVAAKIVLVAGGGEKGPGAPAVEVALRQPFGSECDAGGNLYVVEMVPGNRLLRIDPKGILTHVAGTGAAGDGGDGGPALEALFNGPHNLAVLPDGNVLVADTWNGRVRKVDVKAGTVAVLPGFGVAADKAKGAGPYCITLDAAGAKLYIADLRQIHCVDVKTGEAKVVAGNGQKGRPEDGAVASEAPLFDPRAVAPDRKGNVYIIERGGNALRVVDGRGRIFAAVNADGKKAYCGDGGPALKAPLNGPKHLCVDREDNVIIADTENHAILKYLPREKKVVRIAGTGVKGTAGVGGDPLKCELFRPHGVSVHPKSGEIFISDSSNNRVLKIVR